MTEIGTNHRPPAAGAVAGGGLAGGLAGARPPRTTALVIDAAPAATGRELVDPRLREADAEVRLPRTAAEARTNVRYFDRFGFRVIVAGPRAAAAAAATGVSARDASSLAGALAAVR